MKDVALLQALGLACGVEVGELTARLLDLERVLQDADAARRTYQQAVVDIGNESSTRYASLSWRLPVPNTVVEPTQLDIRWIEEHRQNRPHVAAALTATAVYREALKVWIDTETIRTRRPYLVRAFGPAQPASPSVRAAMRCAYDQPWEL